MIDPTVEEGIFVARRANPAGMKDCVFCTIASGEAPAHRVFEDDDVVAFLDRTPLFHGHVLVVPRTHVVTLADLEARRVGPLFEIVQRLSVAVPRALESEGSFVAINNGVSQSVPHLHVHVVPRKKKDGLKGFFWPRHKYASDDQMRDVAASIRSVLANN